MTRNTLITLDRDSNIQVDNCNITVADIQLTQQRQIYQNEHPIPETDMTFEHIRF